MARRVAARPQSVVEIASERSTSRSKIAVMKSLVVLMLVAGVAVAAPGGYLAAGGVFDFGERNLDFIQQARDAGKFAWSQRLENELEQEELGRSARRADVYIPTFFTSAANNAAALSSVRQQRQLRHQPEAAASNFAPIFYYQQPTARVL